MNNIQEYQNSYQEEISNVSLVEANEISSKQQQISNFAETYKILDLIKNGESCEQHQKNDNDSSFDFSPPHLGELAENETKIEETIFFFKLQIKKLKADLEKEKQKSQQYLEIASKYIENCKMQKFDYDLLYQEKEKIENELNILKEIQIKDTRLHNQYRIKQSYDKEFQQEVVKCESIIGNLTKKTQPNVIVKQKCHTNSHQIQLKQNNPLSQGGRFLVKKYTFQLRKEVNQQDQKQYQNHKNQKK